MPDHHAAANHLQIYANMQSQVGKITMKTGDTLALAYDLLRS